MWTSVQVAVGAATHRARYRVVGDMLVVEWRGGRLEERCGCLKPEFLAINCLKRQLESQHQVAA